MSLYWARGGEALRGSHGGLWYMVVLEVGDGIEALESLLLGGVGQESKCHCCHQVPRLPLQRPDEGLVFRSQTPLPQSTRSLQTISASGFLFSQC